MRIEQRISIDLPIDVVFAYVSDPGKHPAWIAVVLRTTVTSSGPMGLGTTFQDECKVLGHQFVVTSEVTAYEPPRLLVQRLSFGSRPGEVRFTLEGVGEGTTISVVQEGETAGLFKVSDTLLALTLKKQLANDLEMLKALLETAL